MGCGCGGRASYSRPTGASQRTSQHQPTTNTSPRRTNHAPTESPRVVQAAALTQRRAAAAPQRRQV